ncbi:hypothetical protein ACFUCV_14965 [Specibacter sp. NPDC057265]|uniref:hypothetical protein n=1 Tax=Specibacter sp. NPDC057265 TaxID=3346075 RepID=UPI003628FF57
MQSKKSVSLSPHQERILVRDKVIDDQRTRLQLLSAKYFDQAAQLAEAKAECVELKLEISRILKDRRADHHDLLRVGVRILELTTYLGIPLDRTTTEIFHRRGWNTIIPADSR